MNKWMEAFHARRPYVLWSIAMCITLYFGIALYGKSVSWYHARDQLFRLYSEAETISHVDYADSLLIDSLYKVVSDTSYHRDTTVINAINTLLFRLEIRASALDTIHAQAESLYVFVKADMPVWERLRFHH